MHGRGWRVWCLEHKLRAFNEDTRAANDVSADTADLDNRGCSMAMVRECLIVVVVLAVKQLDFFNRSKLEIEGDRP